MEEAYTHASFFKIAVRDAPLQQSLWQVPALLTLALLLAVGSNYWRSGGIPLIGDWSTEARFADASGDSLVIPLERARQLFEEEAAVFVDARAASQYQDGHIQGALNIPWQEADSYFMDVLERLESAQAIITYCDGESCDLSHELALFLKEMGFDNVQVLVNGWTVWKEAGLPVRLDK
ncbi:MAG: rhodanese-like domain-containing protein [Desulfohalobiaceae bacterium]|nr:rhodanese-like domain-containing protein [Desulfohalobiaceae bacterium]